MSSILCLQNPVLLQLWLKTTKKNLVCLCLGFKKHKHLTSQKQDDSSLLSLIVYTVCIQAVVWLKTIAAVSVFFLKKDRIPLWGLCDIHNYPLNYFSLACCSESHIKTQTQAEPLKQQHLHWDKVDQKWIIMRREREKRRGYRQSKVEIFHLALFTEPQKPYDCLIC